MKSISSQFHGYCKERLKPMGFIRQGSVWGRIVRDLYQGISIRMSLARTPVVEFGVLPLCAGIKYYDSITQYRLDDLYPLSAFGFICSGDPRYADLEETMAKLQSMVEENVIKLFEECVDCASSLKALISLESRIEQSRLQTLAYMKAPDKAVSHWDRVMSNEYFMFMALKTGNYNHVAEFIKACERMKKTFLFEWIDKLPIWIEENDIEAIQTVLEGREKLSLYSLRQFIK